MVVVLVVDVAEAEAFTVELVAAAFAALVLRRWLWCAAHELWRSQSPRRWSWLRHPHSGVPHIATGPRMSIHLDLPDQCAAKSWKQVRHIA